MSTEKSPVRNVRFDDLEFTPRFEYGEMAEVAGVCGDADGSELGVGWGRLRNARIPWTIRYDEVLTVFEGELRLHTGGEVHELQSRDCIWLPAGTELVYEASGRTTKVRWIQRDVKRSVARRALQAMARSLSRGATKRMAATRLARRERPR